MERIFQTLGLLGLGLIVLVSVIPGSLRPHTSMSGYAEHFAAYAIVATCLALGWRSPLIHAAIVISSFNIGNILEAAQLLIPDRSADTTSALFSGAGGLCGVVLAFLLVSVWRLAFQLPKRRGI